MIRSRVLALAAATIALGACAAILGIRPAGRRPFEHRKHVLSGIHCSRCHAGVVGAVDEGPLHLPGTAECVACHEQPHDQHACNGCHGQEATREAAALAREKLRFQHKTHVPRVRGDCVRCHVDIHQANEALRPSMATCLGCHEHEDEFEVRECNRCHVDLDEDGTRPESHLVHDGDWLREHGVRAAGTRDLCATCHSESFCASCHGRTAPATPARMRFDEPLGSGMHRAGFRSRHADEARGNPGLCTTCHSTDACAECHANEGRTAAGFARGSPHPSGWLGLRGESNDHGRAAQRDPSVCAACHSGAGEALCVGCHRVGGIGGSVHPPGWSSTLSRSFAPACRPCHEGR